MCKQTKKRRLVCACALCLQLWALWACSQCMCRPARGCIRTLHSRVEARPFVGPVAWGVAAEHTVRCIVVAKACVFLCLFLHACTTCFCALCHSYVYAHLSHVRVRVMCMRMWACMCLFTCIRDNVSHRINGAHIQMWIDWMRRKQPFKTWVCLHNVFMCRRLVSV